MSIAALKDDDQQLENSLIQTFLAGHRIDRGDDSYPKSYSDVQCAIRAVLRRFEIKQRPIDIKLKYKCTYCKGNKKFVTEVEKNSFKENNCSECNGKGYIER